jgi:hypothetical protein
MREDSSFELLPDGSLVLRLAEACIQTTARRAHRELTLALLEGHGAVGAEAALALLELFLRDVDFAAVRARFPELAGGSGARVRLRRADGAVRWEIVGPR